MTVMARSSDRYMRVGPASVTLGPHNPTGWTEWMDQPLKRAGAGAWEFGVNQPGFSVLPSLHENGAPFPGQALFDLALSDAKAAAGVLQSSGSFFSPGLIETADYGFGFDPDPGDFFQDEGEYWLTTRLLGLPGNTTTTGILLPETPVPDNYITYELEGPTAVQAGGRVHFRRSVNVSYRRRTERGFAYSAEIWREAYGRTAHLQLLLGDPNDLPPGTNMANVAGYDWQSNRPSGVGGDVVASYPLVEYPNEANGVDPTWTTQASIDASPYYEWTDAGGKLFVTRVAPPDEDIPFQNLQSPETGLGDHVSYQGEQHGQFQFAPYLMYRHPRVRFLISDPLNPSTTATSVSTRFHRF